MAGYKGQQGRKPKPTALKMLEGTYRPDRANPLEPKPRRVSRLPRCPAHITGAARDEWRRVTKLLDEMHILTVADVSAVECYCTIWGLYRLAYAEVQQHGALIENKKTGAVYANPAVAMTRQAGAEVRRWMGELGLTQTSRTRLEVKAPPPSPPEGFPPADSFEEYLRGHTTR